jgi:hypothetical protein
MLCLSGSGNVAIACGEVPSPGSWLTQSGVVRNLPAPSGCDFCSPWLLKFFLMTSEPQQIGKRHRGRQCQWAVCFEVLWVFGNMSDICQTHKMCLMWHMV